MYIYWKDSQDIGELKKKLNYQSAHKMGARSVLPIPCLTHSLQCPCNVNLSSTETLSFQSSFQILKIGI